MIQGIRTLTNDEILLEKKYIENIYKDGMTFAIMTKNIKFFILDSLKLSTDNVFFDQINYSIILNFTGNYPLLNKEEINLIKGLDFDKIGLFDIKIKVELNK